MKVKRRIKYQNIFDSKVNVDEIIKTRNEIKSNPMLADFWKNIDINQLEDFVKSLEESEEKPKKNFHKEGNVIHLFKKEK